MKVWANSFCVRYSLGNVLHRIEIFLIGRCPCLLFPIFPQDQLRRLRKRTAHLKEENEEGEEHIESREGSVGRKQITHG